MRGARSLVLSGEVADGTVLGDMSSPGFVAWARTRIEEGRRAARRTDRHRLTVYVLVDIGNDRTEARRRIAAALTTGGPVPGIEDGLADEVDALLAATEPTELASVLPDAYILQLCISGSPAACAPASRTGAARAPTPSSWCRPRMPSAPPRSSSRRRDRTPDLPLTRSEDHCLAQFQPDSCPGRQVVTRHLSCHGRSGTETGTETSHWRAGMAVR